MTHCIICDKDVDSSDNKHTLEGAVLYCHVGDDTEVTEAVNDEPDEFDIKLAELHNAIEEIASEGNELSGLEKQVNAMIIAEREAFEQRVAEFKKQLMEVTEKKWDVQRKLRQVRQEAESIERQKEHAERQRIQQKQFESLAAKWDKMVMGAPWREWAKDHQIVGAKKMANARKMILADTMGLGKTLTALVTLDYIEAMTNEASVEHPLVIDVP